MLKKIIILLSILLVLAPGAAEAGSLSKIMGKTFIDGPGWAMLQLTVLSVGGFVLCLIASIFKAGMFSNLLKTLGYIIGADIFLTAVISLLTKVFSLLGV